MAARRVPVRLIVALTVAAALTVFLLYTSFAGGASPSLRPSQIAEHAGKDVQLAGIVIGPITGDARGEGLRFKLKDFDGPETVQVRYTGSVPDQFKIDRHVFLKGRLNGDLETGTFVGEADSLVTKCPSKYAPKEDDAPALAPGSPA